MEQILKPGDFFGRMLAKSELRGFTFIESQYTGGLEIPSHFHESAFFGLVLEGAHLEITHNKSFTCDPGTTIFHPAGERHANRFLAKAGRLFMFEPSHQWLQESCEYNIPISEPTHCNQGLLYRAVARVYDEFSNADEVTPMVLEGLVLEALGALRRIAESSKKHPPRWLELIREQISSSFDENLQFSQLAKTAGVHPVELARAFRRFYGFTAGEYLRQVRIDAACIKLRNSDRPLAEIALDCGFSSQSHFSTAFRRIVGTSPGLYRRRLHR